MRSLLLLLTLASCAPVPPGYCCATTDDACTYYSAVPCPVKP